MPWREALVTLSLRGSRGRELQVEAVVDTGFSGELLLPRAIVDELELALEGEEQVVLADGSECAVPFFSGVVVWDGTPRQVSVLCAGGDPLLGMSLMWNHLLTMRAAEGGEVTLDPLQ
jgi:clan AA aspartic protease